MQLITDHTDRPAVSGHDFSSTQPSQEAKYAQYKIIRRNGSMAGFEPIKISIAMTKAFIAVNGGQGAASARVREVVARLTDDVVNALIRRQPSGGTFHIEDIQDQVELALMRSGEHDVARAYVLYREDRARKRAQEKETAMTSAGETALNVLENGRLVPLDTSRLFKLIESCCTGLGEAVNPSLILKSTLKDLYDGVPMDEVRKSAILSARKIGRAHV